MTLRQPVRSQSPYLRRQQQQQQQVAQGRGQVMQTDGTRELVL